MYLVYKHMPNTKTYILRKDKIHVFSLSDSCSYCANLGTSNVNLVTVQT